jgi:hypothetical protein
MQQRHFFQSSLLPMRTELFQLRIGHLNLPIVREYLLLVLKKVPVILPINNIKPERTFMRILRNKVRRKLYNMLNQQLSLLLGRLARQRSMPPLL